MDFFWQRKSIILILLAVGTFAVFQPMLTHEFLNIDDPVYVTDNTFVQKGLSSESVKWAFTTLHAEFYHPITWLSLMLDTHLFGNKPFGYLFSNLLLHILNTLLLYLILDKLTRLPFHSAVVAMLFAIHPLHIESVAWIAERKDVLSAFFWMLTIWCYIAYVNKHRTGPYILVHLVYLMGLMSKPMLVTLPMILLLLDYWPLERYQKGFSETEKTWRKFALLVKEKLLLFALSATAGVWTIIAQYKGGGLDVMQDIPHWNRISNALISILVYIFRTFWPENLVVYYPFPSHIPIYQVLGSLACVLVITFLCIRSRQKVPYLFVGWSWYMITLLPVLGFLKVGGFATADRYTYIPLIGLFILLSWGVSDLLKASQNRKLLSAGLIGIIILSLCVKTRLQLKNWSDSYALFSHAAKVSQGNDFAYHSLGHIFAADNDFKNASAHFQMALNINPNRNITQKDLARVFAYQGRLKQGETTMQRLLDNNPDYGAAHYIQGLILVLQKRYEEAVVHISKGFKQHPRYIIGLSDKGPASVDVEKRYAQGLRMAAEGCLEEAKHTFERVLDLDSQYHPARIDLSDIMVSDQCYHCALKLFLGQLSDAYLKQLIAAGYQKWPVFYDAKEDAI